MQHGEGFMSYDLVDLKKTLIGLSISVIVVSAELYAEDKKTSDAVMEEVTMEEIIVTALKRPTVLQDTPASISVLSNQTLERIGANDFTDFIGFVPGLSLRDSGPGQSRPVIRGVQGVGEAQVGVYYDEVLFSGAPGTTNDAGRFQPEIKLFDVERIEVLRGPQGTLYGSGSMGGTIRVINNKPDTENFAAKINFQASDISHGGSGFQVNSMLNVPLVENELALRAVLYTRDEDGFVDNIALDQKDINSMESDGGRISLQWTPSDYFSLVATAYHQDQIIDSGFHINPELDGDYLTDVGMLEPFEDEIDIYNISAEYNLNGLSVIYSGSVFERNAVFQLFSPLAGGIFGVQPQPVETETHELRLTSTNNEKNQWTLGGFYQDRDSSVTSLVDLLLPDGTRGPEIFLRETDAGLKQKAIFGEVELGLTSSLKATLGARYFDIENFSAVTLIRAFLSPARISEVDQVANLTEGDETGTTFKLNLAYEVNEGVSVYAQFAQGFRAGGANQNVDGIDIIPAYDSDNVDSYELGMHSVWGDGRVVLNGALYYLKWEDMQVEQTDPTTGLFRFTGNAGEAEISGFEMDLNVNMSKNLQFSAGLNIADAKLSTTSPFNIVGGLSQTGLNGDEIPHVPDITANASVEYGWDLDEEKRAYIYLNANYIGDSNSDFNQFLIDPATGRESATVNQSFAEQGGHAIADFKIGIETDNWDVHLFVNNLTDKRGINTVFADNFRPAPGYNFVERPRIIGMSFSKSF